MQAGDVQQDCITLGGTAPNTNTQGFENICWKHPLAPKNLKPSYLNDLKNKDLKKKSNSTIIHGAGLQFKLCVCGIGNTGTCEAEFSKSGNNWGTTCTFCQSKPCNNLASSGQGTHKGLQYDPEIHEEIQTSYRSHNIRKPIKLKLCQLLLINPIS